MKRLLLVPALLLAALAAYASTALTVNPSEMKNGDAKKLVDGDRTVTVTRNGDAVDIHIEGGAASDRLTINRTGKGFRIDRDGAHTWVMPPMGEEPFRLAPGVRQFRFKNNAVQTWFVCPKDHAMLRVPDADADKTYKCPVDGTTMEKRKGTGFAFFFDDDSDSLSA